MMTMRPATIMLAVVAAFAMAPLVSLSHDGPVPLALPAERDGWIELGTRIHGGFGTLIALGIRIGDDAMRTLKAKPRELDVTYFSGAEAPCPCVVDGILAATSASPGQSSLRVSAERAAAGEFGKAVIRHRPTGATIEYVIPMSAWPALRDANKLPVVARWNAVMQAADDALFVRREVARQ